MDEAKPAEGGTLTAACHKPGARNPGKLLFFLFLLNGALRGKSSPKISSFASTISQKSPGVGSTQSYRVNHHVHHRHFRKSGDLAEHLKGAEKPVQGSHVSCHPQGCGVSNEGSETARSHKAS